MSARLGVTGRLLLLALTATATATAAGPVAALAAPRVDTDVRCDLCHNELEFLRQHAETLEAARALLVPSTVVRASAHEGQACVACHEGFDRHPHRPDTVTHTCADCHEQERNAWSRGVHASEADADCVTCHGVHDVRSAKALALPVGVRETRRRCTSCHPETRAGSRDPHADSLPCSACHAPHATRGPEDPGSRVHSLNQAETCGVCHDPITALWRGDAHGAAVQAVAMPGRSSNLGGRRPPTCTSCHGAHDMPEASDADFVREMVRRCTSCHARYARSFADTYHGQASSLGSVRAATCPDCHTAHQVFASSDLRSSVAPDHVLETCRSCHPAAGENFAEFQPHADPHDAERYPHVYWSYRVMTVLLVGVFALFGVHTVLWLARVAVEYVRSAGSESAAHPEE